MVTVLAMTPPILTTRGTVGPGWTSGTLTPSAVAISEEFLIALAPVSYRPNTVICSERIQTIESVTTPGRIDRRDQESRFITLIIRGG
jgi:hypothetical protein